MKLVPNLNHFGFRIDYFMKLDGQLRKTWKKFQLRYFF